MLLTTLMFEYSLVTGLLTSFSVEYLQPSSSSLGVWNVIVLVVPFMNNQSSALNSETVSRRILNMIVGMFVLVSVAFYQSPLSSSLITKPPPRRLTLEEIAIKIELHELNPMFDVSGSALVNLLK
jgi:hypothetical protein